ncbi:unnamed protein product [Lymnaea stagnalis]|uniref:RNA polymerase II-associated protein 1 n=1 Tax=Lymnaea stagnalis TaxID=6523 RepID=A0AAV2HUX6_LYMST
MNRRPNPNEDEDDLLKLQQEFLAAQTTGSTNIKKPDKRKTENAEKSEDVGHVITTKDNQDSSDVPTKRLKVRFDPNSSDVSARLDSEIHGRNVDEVEDLEEMIDKQDRGLAAVLSTIIERDTRNEMCMAPFLGKQGFPTSVHMNLDLKNIAKDTTPSVKTRKKSLFAQQVEAQGVRHLGVEPAPRRLAGSSSLGSPRPFRTTETVLTGPCLIDGAGLSVSSRESESLKIHEENVEKLSSMSDAEIVEEQQKLLQMIDPKIVEFVRNKRKIKEEEQAKKSGDASYKDLTFSVQKEKKRQQKQDVAAIEAELELPVKANKEWIHMTTVEKDKLEWMRDLPLPSSMSSETGRSARFDFTGNLMAVDSDVPVNMGLHHHGDEPERAGYTLEEMFQLARSSNLQQRAMALHTLARVISNAKSGLYSGRIETPIIPSILAGGVVILLRWALDDSVPSAVSAAVDALHSLLVNTLDEEAIDTTWPFYHGHIFPSLMPTATLEKEDQPADLDEENKEEETDADVVKRDVVQALVTRMELLTRFRYIFDTIRPQADTVIQMIEILLRVAQHSSNMAYEVFKCPGLLDKIIQEFVPTAWILEDPEQRVSCVYGLPVAAALRLIRVLCQAGRNMASMLASRFQLNIILLRYLAVPARDLRLPPLEAVHLQYEALSVWRVCATYGLCMQTYFDLYSNIVLSVGKLETIWCSSQTAAATTSPPGTNEGVIIKFNVGLVSVLEQILCVAGSCKTEHSLWNSGQMETDDIMTSAVNWSHVTALFQPVKTCLIHMLNDLGNNYPAKKQNLNLPTVCLNFLASYFDMEGRQPGVDEVSALEIIEDLSESCLEHFWSSFGLTVITENFCTHSNILAKENEDSYEASPNLPMLGVRKILDQDVAAHQGTEQRKINMPGLLPDSPFGFVTAFLRLLLAVCRRHKGMIPKLIQPAVNNKDVLSYIKKISVGKSQLICSHFTLHENLMHYFWLKCCALVPCPDMASAHRVALQLISRLHYGEEHLVHDLMSTVVFSPAFISEGEEAQLASQALANMSLSESLHLKSATQEEINVNQCQLLRETYSSLSKIRGHFLMAFGGLEKAVQDSRNVFLSNSGSITSLMTKCAGENLMPKDWVFLPLIHVYNNANQIRSVSGMSMSPQAIAMVTSVLQWTYALEIWRPTEMDKLSVTVRLSRILCAFIAGKLNSYVCADLFLEKPVHQYLAGLVRVLSSQKLLDKMDFEEKIPGITSFYDLYQEFLDHYEAVSFGDAVFGLYVLLPLQQKHSSMLRKAVWGERRKMLRTLRVPLEEMLIPVQNFLQPEETDAELLQLYCSALLTNAVLPAWSPVMYLLAVHHLNRFLYTSIDDGNTHLRHRMWKQILNCKHEVSDILNYKQADLSLPRGMELYEMLPPNRQLMLDNHKHKPS